MERTVTKEEQPLEKLNLNHVVKPRSAVFKLRAETEAPASDKSEVPWYKNPVYLTLIILGLIAIITIIILALIFKVVWDILCCSRCCRNQRLKLGRPREWSAGDFSDSQNIFKNLFIEKSYVVSFVVNIKYMQLYILQRITENKKNYSISY